MLILGQDGDTIINFERINLIKIESSENEFDIEINYADDEWDVIGTYESFKRAKEILKEIVNATTIEPINNKRITKDDFDMYMKVLRFNIYKMPEK